MDMPETAVLRDAVQSFHRGPESDELLAGDRGERDGSLRIPVGALRQPARDRQEASGSVGDDPSVDLMRGQPLRGTQPRRGVGRPVDHRGDLPAAGHPRVNERRDGTRGLKPTAVPDSDERDLTVFEQRNQPPKLDLSRPALRGCGESDLRVGHINTTPAVGEM